MSLNNYQVKLQELACCFLDSRLQKFRLRSSETPQRHGYALSNRRSELHGSSIITALSTTSPRLSDHHRSEHNQPTAQQSSPLWTQPAHGSAIITALNTTSPLLSDHHRSEHNQPTALRSAITTCLNNELYQQYMIYTIKKIAWCCGFWIF